MVCIFRRLGSMCGIAGGDSPLRGGRGEVVIELYAFFIRTLPKCAVVAEFPQLAGRHTNLLGQTMLDSTIISINFLSQEFCHNILNPFRISSLRRSFHLKVQ